MQRQVLPLYTGICPSSVRSNKKGRIDRSVSYGKAVTTDINVLRQKSERMYDRDVLKQIGKAASIFFRLKIPLSTLDFIGYQRWWKPNQLPHPRRTNWKTSLNTIAALNLNYEWGSKLLPRSNLSQTYAAATNDRETRRNSNAKKSTEQPGAHRDRWRRPARSPFTALPFFLPPLRLRFHTEFLVPRACSLLQFLSPSQLLASLARSLLLREHQTGVDRDRDRDRGEVARNVETGRREVALRLVFLGKGFCRWGNTQLRCLDREQMPLWFLVFTLYTTKDKIAFWLFNILFTTCTMVSG